MSIKVLVVDDSAFMRRVITDMIKKDSLLEVAGTARNGEEAINKIIQHKPDVVTLDVEMPVLDGVGALKRIMVECPVPVLMVSSVTKEGADITMQALELGAIDFIAKPMNMFEFSTDDMAKELCAKIKSISKVKVKKIIKSTPLIASNDNIPHMKKNFSYAKVEDFKKIVVIGTSTGGPRALQSVVPRLPDTLDAAVLIVQHMPAGFTKMFAQRLDGLCAMDVKEAENNDRVLPGRVLIAPGDYQMKVIRAGGIYKVKCVKEELVSGHRPSVDVLFRSVAEYVGRNAVGAILTGMGKDGAAGMLEMRNSGSRTIAQDEESSVVFGMPMEAYKNGGSERLVLRKL